MRIGGRPARVGILCRVALLTAAAPPPDSPVADAAMRGDREAVRTLLRGGADVNAAQGDGMTALHWAARNGDAELAKMLVYAGAKVDPVTRLGSYTPLHLASRAGNVSVIVALLEAGAEPTATTTSGGATALHFAAAQGNPEAIKALLGRGIDPDIRDGAWGQTPLMWASANGRTMAVRSLLAGGADLALVSATEDIAEREKQDRTSAQARNRRVAALRAAERPPAARAETPAAPAQQARPRAEATDSTAERSRDQPGEQARKELTETSPEQLAARADSVAKAAADTTKAAADTANAAAAQAAQARMDSTAVRPAAGKEGAARPADSTATKEKEPEPLSYGDLVGVKGGLTPLLFAAREGHTETVVALLDAGADVNQVSTGDHTSALLIAVINGHFDLAHVLLERGARPNLASDAGATPLYAALNTQWAPKALYPQPTAHTQQRTTYIELMKALLEAGADPNVRLTKHLWYMSYNFDLLGVNTEGATPFWRAAYATDVPAMKLLVASGADPNIPTRKPPERRRRGDDDDGEQADSLDASGLPPVPVGGPGVWPLLAASGVGYGEGYAANAHRHAPDGWLPAVKYLIEELGVDPNARDHNGYNAIHHAAARGDNELIEYLVEKGVDVKAVSRRGQTTADMANGPVQRVSPFPATVALLEKLGSKNNNKCRSC